MSQKYFTTLTHIGAALHANAQLQQTTVAWTHLVLGDGNGAEPVPSPAQTGVIREVDRLPISSIEPDPDNPSWIVIEAVIPADRGGYVVRETALMGGANGASCIAVGNYPSATKPLLSEGAGSELVIRVVVEIAHTATVTLKIDPAVVIASRDWVEKRHATQQKRGLVRLSTIQEALLGEADDIAVTPEGVMRVATALSADSGMVVLGAPGVHTWEVPEVLRNGKKKASVLVVGGGGGGIVAAAGLANGGAGGGWAEGLLDLNGVASVSVTVATGGASRTDSASTGSGGASSSFGSYLSATGGSGARKASEFNSLSLGSGGIGYVSPSAVAGVAGSGFVGLVSTVSGLGGASYFGGQTGGSFSAADNTVAGAGGPSGTSRGGKGGDGLVYISW